MTANTTEQPKPVAEPAADPALTAAKQEAFEAGCKAERERIRALITDPRLKGFVGAVPWLAIGDPAMPADAIAAFLEGHGKTKPPAGSLHRSSEAGSGIHSRLQ